MQYLQNLSDCWVQVSFHTLNNSNSTTCSTYADNTHVIAPTFFPQKFDTIFKAVFS